ncbi:MAG: hypothetical protein HYX92_09750 [Chloroflexi bacterium]|nr:hypothetical protein [Chloroflexota bacterium]
MARRSTAWFERGADAVARLWPSLPRCYICPLCMRGFLPAALDENVLTLEHVPPQALGGKRILLTCCECNNRAGRELDCEMQALDDILGFARGGMKRAVSAQLTMGEHTLNIEVVAAGER